MNSIEIEDSARKFRPLKAIFKGVFARDTIPHYLTAGKYSRFGLIVNLDKHNSIGSHWVAIFVPRGKPFMEYFDSFGRKPTYCSLNSFLKQREFYQYNNIKLQSVLSTTCGQYCIFYLICRALDISPKTIISFFSKDNFQFNDYLVNETINSLFKVNHKVTDIDFLLLQIKEITKQYGANK